MTNAAGIIAAMPAIATLVQSIAVDAGLENADCRSKVKGICGTSPAAWESLLVGIASAGLLFDLPAIVESAALLASPVVALLDQVG